MVLFGDGDMVAHTIYSFTKLISKQNFRRKNLCTHLSNTSNLTFSKNIPPEEDLQPHFLNVPKAHSSCTAFTLPILSVPRAHFLTSAPGLCVT
mmetsp:Transcript_9552/g.13806  ORF Transcript_9552/g.13806 Transcript_9552/m.13806 type:complete len:93 (-) Transcript_9552:844-1122(-)